MDKQNLFTPTVKSNRVCFIGHSKIYDSEDIRGKLHYTIEQMIKAGCNCYTVGTHGDFDELVLGVLRELRKAYKDIVIEVVITSLKAIEPIIDHDPIFGDEMYVPYEDVQTIIYDIEQEHYKRRIISSNRQMIDTCDTMICYVDTKRHYGGARLAYRYAKRQGLTIVNLYQ